MHLSFSKYQGTGNDFILIDNRVDPVSLSREEVAFLCHRRMGIGADGLMLLETTPDADFHMVYYNSDGNESTMCGNGGRCITAFAHRLGLIREQTVFTAIDGRHEALIHSDGSVSLHMKDVSLIETWDGYYTLDTGSPHFVQEVEDVRQRDVTGEGRAIRNWDIFQPKGINVNFVQVLEPERLFVRTYERGVEDETLSCGTGVTAGAIALTGNNTGTFNTHIQTLGGNLRVSFRKETGTSATEVVLTGPATHVFDGSFALLPGDVL